MCVHFFLIHWPLDGHLCGLCTLAIVSNTAMNTGVLFVRCTPSSGVASLKVVLFIVSWKISILLPNLHSQHHCMWICFFLHLCQLVFIVFFFFFNGHSDQWDVKPHCGFDLYLHSPDYLWCWASFHLLVDHLHFFFGKMSIQFFCSFFIELLFVWCWAVWTVYTCLILLPRQSLHLQISSPIQ